jgi:uncharacterized membrane protein
MGWLLGTAGVGLLFVAVDLVWLSTVGQSLYRPALKGLVGDSVNLAAAVAFYAVYVAGVMVLAVLPGVRAQSVMTASMMGAALGFVAYATYDLTNMATLKFWPLEIAVIDIAWGTALTALAAAAGAWVVMRVGL